MWLGIDDFKYDSQPNFANGAVQVIQRKKISHQKIPTNGEKDQNTMEK